MLRLIATRDHSNPLRFSGFLLPLSTAHRTLVARSGVEPPEWRGATRERARRHVTEEQRSQSGWIGREDERCIPARALSTAPRKKVISGRHSAVTNTVHRGRLKPFAFSPSPTRGLRKKSESFSPTERARAGSARRRALCAAGASSRRGRDFGDLEQSGAGFPPARS